MKGVWLWVGRWENSARHSVTQIYKCQFNQHSISIIVSSVLSISKHLQIYLPQILAKLVFISKISDKIPLCVWVHLLWGNYGSAMAVSRQFVGSFELPIHLQCVKTMWYNRSVDRSVACPVVGPSALWKLSTAATVCTFHAVCIYLFLNLWGGGCYSGGSAHPLPIGRSVRRSLAHPAHVYPWAK